MNINIVYDVETTSCFFCINRLSQYNLISKTRITCLISRVYFYSRMRSTLRNASYVKSSFHIIDVFHLHRISFILYQKHYTNLFQTYHFNSVSIFSIRFTKRTIIVFIKRCSTSFVSKNDNLI